MDSGDNSGISSNNSSNDDDDGITNVINTNRYVNTSNSNTISSSTANATSSNTITGRTSNPSTINDDNNSSTINTTVNATNRNYSPISGTSGRDCTTYTQEDKNYCKLICLFRNLVTSIFFFVFRQGLSEKLDDESLIAYYTRHGINSNKFQKDLCDDQREAVNGDPFGSTFDISLLYFCLRFGYHGLKHNADEVWKGKDDASLESVLTKVKNKRNDLAHQQLPYTKQRLTSEVSELREDLVKILKLCGVRYNLPTTVVDGEITRVKDCVSKYLTNDFFNPKTFEEYKKSLVCEILTELVNTKGKCEIKNYFVKGPEHQIDPQNHIVRNRHFPLDDVYTDMKMQKGKPEENEAVPYKDVLIDEEGSNQKTNSVIVIDGPPGAGKTTLIKKMTLDWAKGTSQMKHLAEHDIILKTECSSRAKKTFEDLIKFSMPLTSEDFNPADLKDIILRQKLMSIMDGLDELNEASEFLFQQMLELKKIYGFTLVITTRHEKVSYIERELNHHGLDMKHIVLVGVPPKKREELCKNYYCAIADHPDDDDFRRLSVHLKRTEQRLADLWESPYHLTLITIFFVFGDGDVTRINTAPRLYREILMLYINKLKERLRLKGVISPLDKDALKKIKQVIDIIEKQSPNVSQDDQRDLQQSDENLKRLCFDIKKSFSTSKSTASLDEVTLDRKINKFIYLLAQQSLIALRDNHIGLPQESYEELEEFCHYNNLSVSEMVGAFLHRAHSEEVVYQYPHKGLQDYLGAFYIWRELTGKSNNPKLQEFLCEMKSLSINCGISQSMIKGMSDFANDFVQKQLTREKESLSSGRGVSIIDSILEDLHISSTDDMSKYQNLAVCLLGLFFIESDGVEVKHKLEALKFIQRTGVRDKKDWLKIFGSVECDEFVASFINKEYKILDGDILIQDNSLTAYISLMKSLKSPVRNPWKVHIDLDIAGELDEFTEILKWIKHHQFKLRTIVIRDNNEAFTNIVKDEQFSSLVPKGVDIDIKVSVGLPEIQELLEALKKGDFSVRTLEVKDNLITDDNAAGYQRSLAVIPQLKEGAFRGVVHIRMRKECPVLGPILDDLNQHQFQVKELELLNFFKDPRNTTCATSVGGDVDQVVLRCHQDMEVYVGPLTEEVLGRLIPGGKRLRHLCVSVFSEDQLKELSAAVAERRFPLYTLWVSLDASYFTDRCIETYPLDEAFQVSLFLSNVDVTFYERTTDLVRRLMPVSPNQGFWCLFFPLNKAPTTDIVRRLRHEGVNIRGCIVFPTNSKPLQGFGQEELGSDSNGTTGRLPSVKWGKSRLFFEEFSEEIQDLDKWV